MSTDLLVAIPRAMEWICLLLICGCPTAAILFPKRKSDPIFHHHVL